MAKKKTESQQSTSQSMNPAEKLANGITEICNGFSLIFAALADQAAAAVNTSSSPAADESPGNEAAAETCDVPSATDPDFCIPDEVDEMLRDEGDGETDTDAEMTGAPAGAKAEKKPADNEATASSLTINDLTKIITAKIRKDRSNNERIAALLKSYGVEKLSVLPEEKYEAFVTDLSQM